MLNCSLFIYISFYLLFLLAGYLQTNTQSKWFAKYLWGLQTNSVTIALDKSTSNFTSKWLVPFERTYFSNAIGANPLVPLTSIF
jgi:membrane-bound metal-dependent hydrolase YbcI (DUF457 family)